VQPDLSTFGGRLFAARCWAGYGNTDRDLYAMTGVTRRRWEEFEANKGKPGYRELEAMRLALGVTYGYLFGEPYDVAYYSRIAFTVPGLDTSP
jgi:transcriptional regulator with XRE-family HTH domain